MVQMFSKRGCRQENKDSILNTQVDRTEKATIIAVWIVQEIAYSLCHWGFYDQIEI